MYYVFMTHEPTEGFFVTGEGWPAIKAAMEYSTGQEQHGPVITHTNGRRQFDWKEHDGTIFEWWAIPYEGNNYD